MLVIVFILIGVFAAIAWENNQKEKEQKEQKEAAEKEAEMQRKRIAEDKHVKELEDKAFRNDELYKQVFAYICSVVKKNLKQVPIQCKQEIPEKWLNRTYIFFQEYALTVQDVNRNNDEITSYKKRYSDFGYEQMSDKHRIEQIMINDLRNKFPGFTIIHGKQSSNKTYGIVISYKYEFDKYSPYKK